jgi:hypothetical protein
MPAERRRVLYPLTAAVVLAYFLFFTWKGIGMYFDADDVMNLYFVWTKPWAEVFKALAFYWSDFYRPLGGLFYRAVFALAGFNPLPFHLVCLAIGIFNIGLCAWFAKLITGSERVVALAALMFAFQPRLIEVWYRPAAIYDLLCFTFFYVAACLYIASRRNGQKLGPWRVTAILICYILALDTKEMAVALPVILLAWELLLGRGGWKRLWLVTVMALMNLPYVYGKTHGASLLANNPFYKPEYSWDRFTHSWAQYLNYILVRETIVPWSAIAILLLLLAIAIGCRSQVLGLAWALIVFGTLPVSFIPYRGGFVLYIAWAGWVLYAAVVLVMLQDLLLRYWPQWRVPVACIVFALVGWRTGKLSLHEQRKDPRPWLFDPPKNIAAMTTQMRALQPTLPRAARLLFLEDSFSTDEWTPYFVMKLAWHDETMTIDRVKMLAPKIPDQDSYQYIFTYHDGRYKRLRP